MGAPQRAGYPLQDDPFQVLRQPTLQVCEDPLIGE
jgi:hypothetical protein